MLKTLVSENQVGVGTNWTKLIGFVNRTNKATTVRVHNLTGSNILVRVVEGSDDKNLDEFYGAESLCGSGGVLDIPVVWQKDYVEVQALASVPGIVKVEELAVDVAHATSVVSPMRTDVGERVS